MKNPKPAMIVLHHQSTLAKTLLEAVIASPKLLAVLEILIHLLPQISLTNLKLEFLWPML